MPKLVLKFEQTPLKEVAVGDRPVTVGRLPDNDLQIDNLAVSSYHARIFLEGDAIIVEDLGSLNGTFLNQQRITRAAAKPGDTILVGKHHIEIHESSESAPAATPPSTPRVATPRMEETVMLDSRRRRELLDAAPAAAEPAAPRLRVPTLIVTRGRTDQREYLLSGKLTVIGKSAMATVRIHGFFARLLAPEVAAQINKRDDGYYLVKAGQVPKVNGQRVTAPTKLSDGDTIEVGSLVMTFLYRS